MNVASLEWIACLLTISSVFFLASDVRVRQALFALCSIGFLCVQSPDRAAWAVLVGFLSTGFLVARLLLREPRPVLLGGYLAFLVAAFVVIKKYSFVQPLLPAALLDQRVVVVGLSYMLFRQVHVLVDAYQGQIQHLTAWNFANYQLNLFGLQAGPIQRFQDFVDQWRSLQPVHPTREEILKAYLRLFLGVVKVLGLASFCFGLYSRMLDRFLAGPPGLALAGLFLASLYLFTAYLYLNFSGYCDIVVAGAGLLGLRMPENFNYPFLARNIGDLWTRWHRTLGFWIRDYLFTPLFKSCVERWPRHAKAISFLAYFVAFCLAGLWHGSTWNFLAFGLLHGGAVAAAKIWEMTLTKRFGRAGFKSYLQNPWIRFAAVLGTFHYFSFTLIFWFHDLDQCRTILRKLSAVAGA